MHIPDLIISGGQTGTDRGALYAATKLGIATGGYAPKDYKTENGPCPDLGSVFGLVELPQADYVARTEETVKLCDAIIMIAYNFDSPGTALTREFAVYRYFKPTFDVPYSIAAATRNFDAILDVRKWLDIHKPSILAFAGNRESKAKGIQRWTEDFIVKLFT